MPIPLSPPPARRRLSEDHPYEGGTTLIGKGLGRPVAAPEAPLGPPLEGGRPAAATAPAGATPVAPAPSPTPAAPAPPRAVPAPPREVPNQARGVRPVPRKGSAKGTAAKGTGTSARGVRLALAVVKLMALAVASAGATAWGMQRQRMMAASESVEALEGTLKAIAGLQYEFQVVHQRFASWGELEAKGATLGPTQQVLRYNVASSHWYLSIIDRKTGAICDQTGELFDEAPGERSPICRSNPQ